MEKWKKFFAAVKENIWLVISIIAICFASWALTMGVAWLVFKIFNMSFSIKVATGIWLIWLIIGNL